jgi:methionyl-tRNA formyltransferase
VVAERLFPVFAEDTVETLKLRTMVSMLELFHDILSRLRSGQPLPEASRAWSRRPFRRCDLEALCHVTPDLPADEIRRRVRATTYPGRPGAAIELGGVLFAAPVPQRPPLA